MAAIHWRKGQTTYTLSLGHLDRSGELQPLISQEWPLATVSTKAHFLVAGASFFFSANFTAIFASSRTLTAVSGSKTQKSKSQRDEERKKRVQLKLTFDSGKLLKNAKQ